MQKTIIFGAPDKDFLTRRIIDNLQHHGFKVIDVSFGQKYKYRKFTDKAYNFIQKIFIKDALHKKRLKFSLEKQEIEKKLSEIEKVDYSLIIRPDVYPKEFLEFLKSKSKKSIGYQWDGMQRFPEIKNYTKFFDEFFVFDEADVRLGFSPITNFYFDDDLPLHLPPSKKQIFFVGSYMKNRITPFIKISEQIAKTDYNNQMMLFSAKEKIHQKYKALKKPLTKKFLSLQENDHLVKESEVLVDILNQVHNGLSFRTFEALKYKKKLITNNVSVKKYDFYNPENILIIETESDYEKIPAFLEKKYHPLPNGIYEKYSFKNWTNYILNIEPHIKITLPNK